MTSSDPKPSDEPLRGDSAALPNDRDERPSAPTENDQHRQNRELIEQGRKDLESGIEDTDRIGIPSVVPTSKDNGR